MIFPLGGYYYLMKRNPTAHHWVASVTMITVAVLLIGSMAVREYAHVLDHVRNGNKGPHTLTSELNHDAIFHCVTEAVPLFEPPCWHQPAVESLQALRENLPSSQLRFLPETRAPPVFA